MGPHSPQIAARVRFNAPAIGEHLESPKLYGHEEMSDISQEAKEIFPPMSNRLPLRARSDYRYGVWFFRKTKRKNDKAIKR
jgi:hypothetical protein